MTVRVGDQDFPDERAIIVAAAKGISTHPDGTWEAPCALCDITCQIDMSNHLWRARTGVRVICLPCAAANYPDTIVGTVHGRTLSMREAVETGLLKP